MRYYYIITFWLPFSALAIPPPPPTAPTIAPTVTNPPLPPTRNCGYKSCHAVKEDAINVHIVPHTHDDVGWLKTVDQYYYGGSSKYQLAGVQYILDTVIESLERNELRKFIYVETAFFWKWWIKQSEIVKSRVHQLVNNGQLEFVSGGWSMNDEATTHYHSIIDQMSWGLRKLNDTFGECGIPKVGWQIDPFGHSKEMANIFAQLGFDGVLLGRIDYQDKQLRWNSRTPEMVWRGSESLGEASDIFTGVMYNTYSPPPGFCFDLLCGDEPIIDDRDSFEYNVDRRVEEFISYLNNLTQVYTTNNLIITMGEDFNYQNADSWFINLDKLIRYVNGKQTKYNLIYSTPSCYVKAIHDETANQKLWALKQDDFFPYASDPHAYWTGYFTSRPAIKRFERVGNNFLQICKQLSVLNSKNINSTKLDVLREAMGVMQHHDAVTGTEKQHVADDYARHLQRGIAECEKIVTSSISDLLEQEQGVKLETPSTCPLLNISECIHTEKSDSFIVTVYNPLSRPVDKIVRLPVKEVTYSAKDSNGKKLITQMVPIPDFVQKIPGRKSQATHEFIFVANDIPPLGSKSFVVNKIEDSHINYNATKDSYNNSVAHTGFVVDPGTGLVKSIQINDVNITVNQNFYYYNGFVGNNQVSENRSSGAYVFRPDGSLKQIAQNVTYKAYLGEVVAEIHQTFNDYVSQIIRVNAIDNHVEFDWVIGPLPNNGTNGIEVVTKYTTNLASKSVFYTDSNGKEMLRRVRNARPTYKLSLTEPASANYYPVTTQIGIEDVDGGTDFAVLVDRAQGGTSLKDGEIELMVHRNCLHDDAFGVGEALNESAFGTGLVIRGSHYVTAAHKDSGTSIAELARDIAQRKLLDSWIFITPTSNQNYQFDSDVEYSALQQPLPKNVQILTLEPWCDSRSKSQCNRLLLRLEHVYEINEDKVLSTPVDIEIANIFGKFKIESVQETTLGANQWLKDNHRLHFKTKGEYWSDLRASISPVYFAKVRMDNNIYKHTSSIGHADFYAEDSLRITLHPGQIRTFIVEVSR